MTWIDHPRNPLIRPRWWSWIVGDPSVLVPAETPDGAWHLFANNVLGVYHYRSDDGLAWRCLGCVVRSGIRAWVRPFEGRFVLYCEHIGPLYRRSHLEARTSDDLLCWSAPQRILVPTLPWEGRHASNPCVLHRDGRYELYYSADLVHLDDMGFSEPRYVSRAVSGSPLGPFTKRSEPIFGPDPGHAYRSRGAGALKVYADLQEGWLIGFANGIYRNDQGRSASAILLLRSPDGLEWEEHPANPILGPTDPKPGWRRAHVYQLDVRRVGSSLWMYYNARDGWRIGVERIGLAVLEDATRLWEE